MTHRRFPHLIKTFTLNTKYTNEPANIFLASYENGDPALVAETALGEPLLTATVNLSGYGISPEEGNVIIKDWSENEGTLAALRSAGIIGETLHTHKAGYAEAYECELLIKG